MHPDLFSLKRYLPRPNAVASGVRVAELPVGLIMYGSLGKARPKSEMLSPLAILENLSCTTILAAPDRTHDKLSWANPIWSTVS